MVVNQNIQDIYEALSKTSSITLPVLKQNPLNIDFKNNDEAAIVYDGPGPVLPFAESHVYHGNITQWKRVTELSEDCKHVYEVTFDIADTNFTFKPGDTIGVIPKNAASDVDFITQHLDLQIDVAYTLTIDTGLKGKVPPHIPVKATLRYVLTHCVDLRSVVKKLFILALSKHTKDEKEQRILEHLCSKEGSSTYNTHILNKNLCVLDIFSIFTTCKPPIQVLLANLPRLLPRPYSIVNSQLKHPDVLKICFSVMDIGNNRKGLTTAWLEDIVLQKSSIENGLKNLSINEHDKNDGIPIYIRTNVSGFRMTDVETPMLLIGSGTGVAPFIGFLEEREMIKRNDPERVLGETWLFFGCRNPKLDFIYAKELDYFIANGALQGLVTAFSRIENHRIKYVQDALLQEGEKVTKLIRNGAVIFVCGDLKTMATQVKDVLVQCLITHDDLDTVEAEKVIADMQKEKKYLVDIWS